MRVSVCVPSASDSSETIEVIIIKLSTATSSDTVMHHVLTMLTLAFIQGHTYLNHGNNKCLIVSETIQAMPIKSQEQLRLKRDKSLTSTIIAISRTVFKLWHSDLA